MAQISRVYKHDVLMLIRVFGKNYKCQSRQYYYKVLGISPNSTQQEIKDAYIKLSKEMHPDSAKGNHADFVKINEAYHILSRKSSRRYFDTYRTHERSSNDTGRYNRNKQWESYGFRSTEDYKKPSAQDRAKAIQVCLLIVIFGVLFHVVEIVRWAEYNKYRALEKSAKIQKDYERHKEEGKNRTMEENIERLEEYSKKFNPLNNK